MIRVNPGMSSLKTSGPMVQFLPQVRMIHPGRQNAKAFGMSCQLPQELSRAKLHGNPHVISEQATADDGRSG